MFGKKKIEKRSYTAIISNALEEAAGTKSSGSNSSAREAAARFYENEISGCKITAPAGADLRPEMLGWLARQAMQEGESIALVSMSGDRARLLPVADHDWQESSNPDEETWNCKITIYAPSGSVTRVVERSQLVVLRWSINAYSPGYGKSPTAGAGSAAQAAAKTEQKINEHANTPVASILTIPDGSNVAGDDSDDPFGGIKRAIKSAAGKILMLETTTGGYGAKVDAPQRDWSPTHLRPEPRAELVEAASDSYFRMIAACGLPPALFDARSDGTSMRESLRQARMRAVQPLLANLERELQRRIDPDIRLMLDGYALDIVGRAGVVQKLVAAGVEVGQAMRVAGLENEG